MSVIDMDGVLIDDASGEILDVEDGTAMGDAVRHLVYQRHYAHEQVDQWRARQAALDRALLRYQPTGTELYGDILAQVRADTYQTLDADAFARAVQGAHQALFDANIPLDDDQREQDAGAVLAIIAAIHTCKREALPPLSLTLYEAALVSANKKPWVETRPVRRPAPALTVVPRTEEPS